MDKSFLYAIGILFMQSCTRQQCPPDDLFKSRDFSTLGYQKDLVKMLKTVNRDKVDYYIEKYLEENSRQYLLVEINSNELCAYVTMDITDCANFGLLKEKKGMSFIGAGLNNPKFHIDSTNGTYKFTIDHIDGIYD